MVVIRKEQMAAFRMEARKRFAERMRIYIAEEYPAVHEYLGDEGTKQLIQKGIETAARYGIDDNGPTAALIELMVQFGEQLEGSPERAWAERILADPELPGVIKLTVIRDRFEELTGGRRFVLATP